MRFIHEFTARSTSSVARHPRWKQGSARVLAIAILLIVGAGGAVWFYLGAKARKAALEESNAGINLSDSTRSALKRLRSPVEIRFYAVLREAPDPDPLRTFSGRVDHLLSAYEREAGDKVQVIRFQSRSAEDMDAASADEIKAFNLARGEPCYLGLALQHKERKETLPRLSPEWESALEADLTRAILRVSGTRSRPGTDALSASALDAREVVTGTIPDLDKVPLEKGRQILRERAFKELKESATEMEKRVEQARQQLVDAQNSGSEEKKQAAMKQMREAQAAQADMLKEVSARLDARINALEELKEEEPDKP